MNKRNFEGITLIALVITIIILLILAGLSIQILAGENGLIEKTVKSKQVQEKAEEKELVELAVATAQIDGHGDITKKNLNDALQEMFNNTNEVSDFPEGWKYQGEKLYNIYKNGKVEEAEDSGEVKALPDVYQKVEYIESDGSQYIDTKVETTSGYRITTSLNITSWCNGNVCYFAGFLSQGIYRDYTVIYAYKPMLGMCTDVQSSTVCALDTWYNIDASTISNNGYFKLDGKELVTSTNTVSHDSYNIWLFGVNYYDTGKFWNCCAKMKETQIYDSSNTLVRNYIPCYCKSKVNDVDGNECKIGTVGMYDTVTHQFYTNQGTGSFSTDKQV